MKDRYQIISTISTGGTGSVFQAWDKSANRDVAIKRVKAGTTNIDSLMWEARALYGLRHPNLVTVLEYEKDEEGAYLVMEMIKGETLGHRLASGPLDTFDFRTLVSQTLDALGAAHEAGLIHRDLKPENIMVPWTKDKSFGIKIIDFGLAQAGGPQTSMEGSIHYMAPEQFGSGFVDARTDLYALGCIYYQALTGQLAYPGEEKMHVITAKLYPPRVPLAELRPDLKDEVCSWVEWLMHVQPAARPANALQAHSAFRQIGSLTVGTAAALDEPESVVMVLEDEELPTVQMAEDEPEPPALTLADEEEPETTLALAEEPKEEPKVETFEPAIEAEEASFVELESEPEATAPQTEWEEQGPTPETLEPTLEPESETEEEPIYSAPVPTGEITQTLATDTEPEVRPGPYSTYTAAPIPAPSAPSHYEPEQAYETAAPQRRPAPASSRSEPRRGSFLNALITIFVVILIAEFGLISYLKFAGREGREQRLAELSSADYPEGSDIDVRMLMDFLDAPAQREQATKVLKRLQGGDYIDTLLVERLEKMKSTSSATSLVQIIGQRRIPDGFTTVLELTGDGRNEVRQAAWAALGRLTTNQNLPVVLQTLSKRNKLDQTQTEQALVDMIEAAEDRSRATADTLKAYHAATGHPDTRALLFNVIVHVGGDKALDVVNEALGDPAVKLRLAAITVLAEYPTHEPLQIISQRFETEKDDTCRAYLLIAARELVSKPGPSSQQTLFLIGRNLYSKARGNDERRYALSALSSIVSPATATFFEEVAQNLDDPALRSDLFDIVEVFKEKLDTQVVHIPPAGKADLVANKADYAQGGKLTVENDALINWTDGDDWASWLVEIPANGEYEIDIYQSHTSEMLGTYEILLAGQTLLTAVVQTDSATDYKGFIAGNVHIDQPGIYRLRIRPKTIPPDSELFRVQKLVVKKL